MAWSLLNAHIAEDVDAIVQKIADGNVGRDDFTPALDARAMLIGGLWHWERTRRRSWKGARSAMT